MVLPVLYVLFAIVWGQWSKRRIYFQFMIDNMYMTNHDSLLQLASCTSAIWFDESSSAIKEPIRPEYELTKDSPRDKYVLSRVCCPAYKIYSTFHSHLGPAGYLLCLWRERLWHNGAWQCDVFNGRWQPAWHNACTAFLVNSTFIRSSEKRTRYAYKHESVPVSGCVYTGRRQANGAACGQMNILVDEVSF